jgi:integrase
MPAAEQGGGQLDNKPIERHRLWMMMKGNSDTTIYGRTSALKRAAKIIGCPVEDASRDQLVAWRASLAGHADAYILAQVSHVRCYLAWLADTDGYRPDNPARHIPVPRKPLYLPRPIGEAELLDAIDNAPGRIRLWLVLAAWCGLRAKEIALLRRRNIRETAPRPHILVAADATKGRRPRVVPLSPFAVEQIRAARLPAAGWAFPRLDGAGGPLTPHRVSELCNDLLHGLGHADTLHSLRHRFGTRALAGAAGNVRVAQELLGHARLDTTAVYTLVESPEAAAAVEAIPAPRRLRAAGLTSGDFSELPAA